MFDPRHPEGWLSTIHRDTSCTWLELSVCLAFLVIGLQGATVQDPLPPSPQPFPNLLIRPKMNPEKKRHISNHIYKQCTQRDFICEDVMSQRICQFMFIIPGGCERWMSFLHWKVQLSVIFRGSCYYSLCCMMKNWSWNQKKEHTQNGFLVILWKTDDIWELGMCTLWIKKNDSSDEWSLCVVYKSRITVSAQCGPKCNWLH